MEKQSVESDTNRELIDVVKNIIEEVNKCSMFSEVCIKNVVRRVSDLVDEFESLDERIGEYRSDRDYWEDEHSRIYHEKSSLEDENSSLKDEISSLEDEISSLRNEIDDLKEQLSNKE